MMYLESGLAGLGEAIEKYMLYMIIFIFILAASTIICAMGCFKGKENFSELGKKWGILFAVLGCRKQIKYEKVAEREWIESEARFNEFVGTSETSQSDNQ